MPTVLLLDVSLSMARQHGLSKNLPPDHSSPTKDIIAGEVSKKALAVHTVYKFLDFLSVHAKLEYVCLMVYSSLWEVKVPFTRDYDQIRSAVDSVSLYDKTCLHEALLGVQEVIQSMWGNTVPCQIVVITDGFMELSPQSISQLKSVSYPFPYDLHMLCLSSPDEFCCDANLKQLKSLMDEMKGSFLYPDSQSSFSTLDGLVERFISDTYKVYSGILHCGNLKSNIQLFPPPATTLREDDFSTEEYKFPNEIHVLGFLSQADMRSPACISRHLVIPLSERANGNIMSDADSKAEDGRTPSFCVLLHGALKVGSYVAVSKLREDWFGMLHSFADSKKKSNLVLSVFKPGVDAVPWLGDMSQLGPLPNPSEQLPGALVQPAIGLPVLITDKKSYSSSSPSWLRQSTLQSDVQKLLRNGRKLPDKNNVFYKELNRIHKSAVSIGFYELLIGLSEILERECRLLPSTAHPEAAMQLQHAASELSRKDNYSMNYIIQPLNTNFDS